MNSIRMFLFRLWVWRTNARFEKLFVQKLTVEQDTVRLKWDDILGSENGGRHHLRKR